MPWNQTKPNTTKPKWTKLNPRIYGLPEIHKPKKSIIRAINSAMDSAPHNIVKS